jgi:hypothetical protein
MLDRIDLLTRIKNDSLLLAQYYSNYIEIVINVNKDKNSAVVSIIMKNI